MPHQTQWGLQVYPQRKHLAYKGPCYPLESDQNLQMLVQQLPIACPRCCSRSGQRSSVIFARHVDGSTFAWDFRHSNADSSSKDFRETKLGTSGSLLRFQFTLASQRRFLDQLEYVELIEKSLQSLFCFAWPVRSPALTGTKDADCMLDALCQHLGCSAFSCTSLLNFLYHT